MFSQAKSVVKYRLKDSESAKFRNLRMSKTHSGGDIVKGEVNAKNSFGGYAGFEKFIYLPNDGSVKLESEAKKSLPELHYIVFVRDW